MRCFSLEVATALSHLQRPCMLREQSEKTVFRSRLVSSFPYGSTSGRKIVVAKHFGRKHAHDRKILLQLGRLCLFKFLLLEFVQQHARVKRVFLASESGMLIRQLAPFTSPSGDSSGSGGQFCFRFLGIDYPNGSLSHLVVSIQLGYTQREGVA